MLNKITIQGLVQGVGFRPFIYLLAGEMGIKGTVANRNNGVVIFVDASKKDCETFIHRINNEHPPVASIHSIEVEEIPESDKIFTDFSISSSSSESEEVTQVAPDIAVCDECLNDRQTQPNRLQYPFINCTHCGPRFSIIRDLPYDRSQTTMAGFEMCPNCQKDFEDIKDRRFHAQPIACNHCGPEYYDETGENNYEKILNKSVVLLNEGKVIAVKGIGGYHLICDANNEQAVKRLREIKIRDTKPFAVMFKDIGSMEFYVEMNESEKECITSWRRPIVLLSQRHCELQSSEAIRTPLPCGEGLGERWIASGDALAMTSAINPGMKTLGCMLPYMPIHYDWFKKLKSPVLVMTSGNLNDCPIIITPEEAESGFGGNVDLIIHHNRPIHNRVDDSVVQICGGQVCLIRRSRGFVPEPFFTDISTEGILAFGAEKVNTFALGKENTVIQSQYIGDLKNEETFSFYNESMERFQHLFRFTPKRLVCDLHPDYFSSLHAEKIAMETGLPLLKVQHHHAHAVACMVEYRLREPVIAVVWDGTGLGDDGAAWGGEFFLCDRKHYKRLSYPEYVPMPGGDKVALEPWRMAFAYLHHYQLPAPDSFAKRIGQEKINQIQTMIEKKINSPLTSSVGRLFDGFASLIGICDRTSRQAEAAILLEQQVDKTSHLRYPIDTEKNPISFELLFKSALEDIQKNVPVEIMASKFHNTLADLVACKVKQFAGENGINQVVVSGGCFQNKFLVEEIQRLFSDTNISLYLPARIPCNDSGIAVGQLVIASEYA